MGIDYKNFALICEDAVNEQVNRLIGSKVFDGETLRLQADCHAGKGCVVGTCLTYTDRIVPNIVGVDIGCRVSAIPLSIGVEELDLARLDDVIRRVVPAGNHIHDNEQAEFDYDRLVCWNNIKDGEDRFRRSIGTLGSGNHYIAVEVSDSGIPYLMVHTGSRNLGLRVANFYQRGAVLERDAELQDLFDKVDDIVSFIKTSPIIDNSYIEKFIRLRSVIDDESIDDELCYLEHKHTFIVGASMSDAFEAYLNDMNVVVEWSKLNHHTIIRNIADAYGNIIDDNTPMITSVHNYVDTEHHVIRKGAIAAYDGQLGIIPMNMRDGSLIVRGKGNDDYLCSAPHGAGRIMSRSQARREISLGDYEREMSDIYTTSVGVDTIDEAPGAYKPVESILPAIQDTVDVIERTHPIYNFKAGD